MIQEGLFFVLISVIWVLVFGGTLTLIDKYCGLSGKEYKCKCLDPSCHSKEEEKKGKK